MKFQILNNIFFIIYQIIKQYKKKSIFFLFDECNHKIVLKKIKEY